MKTLTCEEREVLVEVGEPYAGPIPDAVFDQAIELGWGFWGDDGFWHVTPAGRAALELDLLSRGVTSDPCSGFRDEGCVMGRRKTFFATELYGRAKFDDSLGKTLALRPQVSPEKLGLFDHHVRMAQVYEVSEGKPRQALEKLSAARRVAEGGGWAAGDGQVALPPGTTKSVAGG